MSNCLSVALFEITSNRIPSSQIIHTHTYFQCSRSFPPCENKTSVLRLIFINGNPIIINSNVIGMSLDNQRTGSIASRNILVVVISRFISALGPGLGLHHLLHSSVVHYKISSLK